ncbi:MAG: PRC-barrel domain-containing protein [Limisphaerales bacterium]
MKNARQFRLQIIVAALCMTALGLMNLPAQIVPNAPTQPEIPRQADAMTSAGQPLRVNKCSQLVGTRVENPRGQTLGTIEDVVVDFNTGRVSYCVLGIGRGAFRTPRYLAVPLTAMRPNASGTDLILNADKEKLAEAQGFDLNHWPSVSNPAWGAQPPWQAAPTAPAMAPSSHELPRVQ